MCIYKTFQLKHNSETQKPDRLQHDRPAASVIAQQYSSATFVSLRFHYPKEYLKKMCSIFLRRDSSDGLATRYELDRPWIESRCGRDFPHLSKPDLEPTQPPAQWVSSLLPRGTAAGVWR
jgi:hypothetical protein